MFTKKQIDFMLKLGLEFDFNNLSDEEWVEIEDTVADRLQFSGFDENYNITKYGEMCESILDMLP